VVLVSRAFCCSNPQVFWSLAYDQNSLPRADCFGFDRCRAVSRNPEMPLAGFPLNKTVIRPASVGTQDLAPLVNTAQLGALVEI
jgi:hypothetical protein